MANSIDVSTRFPDGIVISCMACAEVILAQPREGSLQNDSIGWENKAERLSRAFAPSNRQKSQSRSEVRSATLVTCTLGVRGRPVASSHCRGKVDCYQCIPS